MSGNAAPASSKSVVLNGSLTDFRGQISLAFNTASRKAAGPAELIAYTTI